MSTSNDRTYDGAIYGYVVDRKDDYFLKESSRKLEAWAKFKADRSLTDLIVDSNSRTEFKELTNRVKLGDTIVMLDFKNAFSRSHDFLDYMKEFNMRGVKVVFINEGLDSSTPYGRFAFLMFGEVSGISKSEQPIEISPEQAAKIKEILSPQQLTGFELHFDVFDPDSSYHSSDSDN